MLFYLIHINSKKMTRERMASHLLDMHETGANKKKEGGNKEEQEQPDAHLRHFLDDEENPQETRENTEDKEENADSEEYEKKQEDKSKEQFDGIEMEGEKSGKLKIEKGENEKESLTKFFVANAEKLREKDAEQNISTQQWAQNQVEKLLVAKQERNDAQSDHATEGNYIELDLSDPENVKIKEDDEKNKKEDSAFEEDDEKKDVYEQQKEKNVESDREKQGDNKQDEIVSQAEQPTIESIHQKDEKAYNEKMLKFKLGDLGLSTQEAADTTFADLSQTQEGKALNDSVKQLGVEKGLDAPANDENITDYLSRSMEEGKVNWDDIDALVKKNENKKER